MGIRASEEDIRRIVEQTGATIGLTASLPVPQMPRAKGRVQRHETGRMNGLEKAYAAVLDARKAAGEIAGYWFEAVKLRLADATYYTPDFMILNAVAEIEFHETKGFVRDDARVKWKVAAEQFPMFAFVQVRRVKKQWVEERYR